VAVAVRLLQSNHVVIEVVTRLVQWALLLAGSSSVGPRAPSQRVRLWCFPTRRVSMASACLLLATMQTRRGDEERATLTMQTRRGDEERATLTTVSTHACTRS
jgi:hypothetical protein